MCSEIDVVLLENTHYVDVVPHVQIERPYVLKISTMAWCFMEYVNFFIFQNFMANGL